MEAMQPTVSVSTVPTLMMSSKHSAMALSPDDWNDLVASRPRMAWLASELLSRSSLKRSGLATWVSLNQLSRVQVEDVARVDDQVAG